MGKSTKSTSATRKNTGALLKASYKSQKDAAKDLEKDYTYDKELSSMDTKVFVNKETGKPVVVHRGTTTLKDWGTDLLVGAGLSRFSGRFQRAKKVTAAVEKKYGTSADAVGHSLGGNLAEHSGNHGETVTLNKAVGVRDMFAKRRSSQTDIYTEGDVIGAPGRLTQRGAHKEVIKNTSGKGVLNAHKVDNLIFHDQDATEIKAGGNGSSSSSSFASHPNHVVIHGTYGVPTFAPARRSERAIGNSEHNYFTNENFIHQDILDNPLQEALFNETNYIYDDMASSFTDSFLKDIVDSIVPATRVSPEEMRSSVISGSYGNPPPYGDTTKMDYPYKQQQRAGGNQRKAKKHVVN